MGYIFEDYSYIAKRIKEINPKSFEQPAEQKQKQQQDEEDLIHAYEGELSGDFF